MENISRSGGSTDDNMAHEHCMVDTYDYKHVLGMCNTYGFSTATMVAQRAIMLHYTYNCFSGT